MIYDIKLVIDYSYAAASDHVRNILRLLPSDGPNQKVTSRLLTVDPKPDEQRERKDFFGNITTSVAWHSPVDRITFRLRARAERRVPEDEADLSPPLGTLDTELAAFCDLGARSPHHFLMPSPRIEADAAMRAFAAEHAGHPTTRAVVQAMGEALHEEMRFDSAATDVNTPPAEAFAARHGVCQDFAQIMIGCLRSLGVPAAYVSGFLRTYPPEGQPRLEGVDAMHAWVAAWCGVAEGWVEYDPTNRQAAGEDYIMVA
ncbi:MAG: transglutaminase domain-containing protein, partial [Gemmobacter sp.]